MDIAHINLLHQADRDRYPDTIRQHCLKSLTLHQMSQIHSQRTAREKTALKTLYGIKDTSNALLKLPIDLHKYMHIVCT